jgi:hypothetical protein
MPAFPQGCGRTAKPKTNRTGGILYLDYNKQRVSRIEPVLQFKQAKFVEYPSG